MIPEGEFVMGDANSSSPDQCPPHILFIDEFRIDAKEVTVKKYAIVGIRNCSSCGETVCQWPIIKMRKNCP